MHRRLYRLLCALPPLVGLALLGACASTPRPVVDFKSDYDFSRVQKVGFYAKCGQVSGDNPLQLSDMQIERANKAFASALRNRGLVVVDDPAQADLLLAWYLDVQHKTDVRTYETPAYGVGYGVGRGPYGRYNTYSMYSCWNCSNTEVRVVNYTEGTLIVDMIDPNLHKSVWRSVTQSRLKGDQGEDQARYDAAAELVLGAFPPGRQPPP